MSGIEAIILGLIEGITEFLPVSSTGHLVLAQELLGITHSDNSVTFNILVQGAAILAVVAVFWRRLVSDRKLWEFMALGFIPTAAVGLALSSPIKALLGSPRVIVIAMGIGGVLMVAIEYWLRHRTASETLLARELTHKSALIIGCIQAIAFIPGVSRSAATIMGGLMLGINRTTVVEFSFFLAIPVLLAATGLDIIQNREILADTSAIVPLVIGALVAGLVAYGVIRWLMAYIKRFDFVPFGWYRIIFAILMLVVLW